MRRLVPYAVVLTLAACAQVRDPQGGPRDVAPPRLAGAEPAMGTTGFSGQRIVLHFDERITLDRPRERIVMSPPPDLDPEYRVVGGTSLEVLFRSPLRPNTTHAIAVGEAVVDLAEGNPAGSLTFVFSTGPVLDSLGLRGTVRDAFSDEPVKDALVMLRTDTVPDSLRTTRPAYLTRTDAQGSFTLTNLAPGRYAVSALRDRNGNHRYDLPDEAVAFAPVAVAAGDSAPVMLRLFREEPAAQAVMDARVLPDRAWRLVLSRRGEAVRARSLDRAGGVLRWSAEWSAARDTVLLWPSDTTLLNDQRFLVYEGDSLLDTLAYRTDKRMPFLLHAVLRKRGPATAPGLLASRPLARITPGRALLRTAGAVVPINLSRDTLNARSLILDGGMPPEGAAQLELLPGALEDIYGGRNDTLRFDLSALREGPAGELRLSLTADTAGAPAGPFLLEVLDAQDIRVIQLPVDALPHRCTLGALPTGSYRPRLVVDADGNGRWTTGALRARRQPERVLRLSGEVNVRAGWELEVAWPVGLN